MQAFTAARTPATRDEIWLTEHPPVYTLGLAGRREHLLRDNGIPALKVDRGGQITYHGPGQLVAYLLFDLKRRDIGIRAMVRAIEASVVEWLDSMGISAYGKAVGAGSVRAWWRERKRRSPRSASRCSNGCTYHGLALNVAMDLAPFADIDPCGYKGLAVTQLADLGVVRDRRGGRRRARADSRRPLGTAPHDAIRAARSNAVQRGRRQAQGGSEDGAHPHQGRCRRAAEEARLDPRARAVVAALPRDQEDPARASAAHGVRGSLVPEHRRVLRQGHRDVHDHGRHLHAALPVLRRRPRPPAAARRRGAASISRRRSPR